MEDRITRGYAIGELIQYAIANEILTIPIPPQTNTLPMFGYTIPGYVAIDKFRMNSNGAGSYRHVIIDIVGAGLPYRILTVDGDRVIREKGPWDGPLDNALDILNKAVNEHQVIATAELEKRVLTEIKLAEARKAEVAALFIGEMI